jgi:dipeptidyl aminopeptidase/acylaminoacyl peptidase
VGCLRRRHRAVADGKRIYTTAGELGRHPLFAFRSPTAKWKRGRARAAWLVRCAGNTLVFSRSTLQSPATLFYARADGSKARAITPSAGEIAGRTWRFGEFEQFNFKGWNDETVHGYVVKPWNYEEGKKYPVAFLIHGGPQGSFGDGWSYRWNPQTYAGAGLRGGDDRFPRQHRLRPEIHRRDQRHWGGRPLEDLQKGWAAAQAKYSVPRWQQGLRARRQLRRLHDQLDRRQLV